MPLVKSRVGAPLAALLVAALASSSAFAQVPDAEGLDLSPEVRQELAERGFVVVPGGSADFSEAYTTLAESGLPAFITADSVLRITDLLIDRVLRTVEDVYLYDRLEQLSREMIRLLEDDYLRASDTTLREAARRDVAFFAVGLSLMDPDYFPPESVRGLVERELELIEDADRTVISPIMGKTPLDQVVGPGEDYTAYVPRGHYADSEKLGRYYRALMWYSRMAFALPERPIEDYMLTMQALLIVRALEREAGDWYELWERVSSPLLFYYGGAGDPSVADYMVLADDVFGREFERTDVASESLLVVFVDRVSEIAPTHAHTHELRGMRFLPRDFPPATNYFGLLAGSEDRPLPTSLDMMALLGSPSARSLIDENDVFDDSVYRRSYESIERELETLTYGDWTRDLYWSWLYCLSALEKPLQAGAPEFALGTRWGLKELSTGGAAWAAVRYKAGDVVLTAGAAAPPSPGTASPAFVEPYPDLYSRLRELLGNLRDRLWEHYMRDDEIDSNIAALEGLLLELERASEHVLAEGAPGAPGAALSNYAGTLSHLVGAESDRSPGTPGCVLLSDAAYIDLDTGRVLENAVGTPDIIYVLAGPEGARTVYAGAVYSFYETETQGLDNLKTAGWPSELTACPIARPYWVSRFLVE